VFQFDLWGVSRDTERWNTLKERIKKVGLRNSLLIAIAPTAEFRFLLFDIDQVADFLVSIP